jgi:hypothetical protein
MQTDTRNDNAQTTAAATASTLARPAWKKALGALSGPALRLHHYRDVRTKILHEAMFRSDRRRCGLDAGYCDPDGR